MLPPERYAPMGTYPGFLPICFQLVPGGYRTLTKFLESVVKTLLPGKPEQGKYEQADEQSQVGETPGRNDQNQAAGGCSPHQIVQAAAPGIV